MSEILTGRLAFASGKAGDYDLWTLDLGTAEMRQITQGSFWNDKPKWSPDGEWIVFASNCTGLSEIFKIAAQGGDAIQLTDLGRWADSPQFSPEGKEIAYISNESGNMGAGAGRLRATMVPTNTFRGPTTEPDCSGRAIALKAMRTSGILTMQRARRRS